MYGERGTSLSGYLVCESTFQDQETKDLARLANSKAMLMAVDEDLIYLGFGNRELSERLQSVKAREQLEGDMPLFYASIWDMRDGGDIKLHSIKESNCELGIASQMFFLDAKRVRGEVEKDLANKSKKFEKEIKFLKGKFKKLTKDYPNEIFALEGLIAIDEIKEDLNKEYSIYDRDTYSPIAKDLEEAHFRSLNGFNSSGEAYIISYALSRIKKDGMGVPILFPHIPDSLEGTYVYRGRNWKTTESKKYISLRYRNGGRSPRWGSLIEGVPKVSDELFYCEYISYSELIKVKSRAKSKRF